jgi:hypothetical protein
MRFVPGDVNDGEAVFEEAVDLARQQALQVENAVLGRGDQIGAAVGVAPEVKSTEPSRMPVI